MAGFIEDLQKLLRQQLSLVGASMDMAAKTGRQAIGKVGDVLANKDVEAALDAYDQATKGLPPNLSPLQYGDDALRLLGKGARYVGDMPQISVVAPAVLTKYWDDIMKTKAMGGGKEVKPTVEMIEKMKPDVSPELLPDLKELQTYLSQGIPWKTLKEAIPTNIKSLFKGGSEIETEMSDLARKSLMNKDITEQAVLEGMSNIERAIGDPNVQINTWEELKSVGREGVLKVINENRAGQTVSNIKETSQGVQNVFDTIAAPTTKAVTKEVAERANKAQNVADMILNPRLKAMARFNEAPQEYRPNKTLSDLIKFEGEDVSVDASRGMLRRDVYNKAMSGIRETVDKSLSDMTPDELDSRFTSMRKLMTKNTFSQPGFNAGEVMQKFTEQSDPRDVLIAKRFLGGADKKDLLGLSANKRVSALNADEKRAALTHLNNIIDKMYKIIQGN